MYTYTLDTLTFPKNMLKHVFNQMTIPTNSPQTELQIHTVRCSHSHLHLHISFTILKSRLCPHECMNTSMLTSISELKTFAHRRRCTHTSFHVHPYFILMCSHYSNWFKTKNLIHIPLHKHANIQAHGHRHVTRHAHCVYMCKHANSFTHANFCC